MLLQGGVLDGDVLLEVPARKLDFLILATAINAHQHPVPDSRRKAGQDEQEDIGPEARPERQDALQEERETEDDGGEVEVRERAIALCKPN